MGINDYDDIAALPSVDSVEPGDYLKANPSIQAQNNDRLIWNRSIIEAAYCIENGRTDYCDNLTPVTLMFDPKYALYITVNDLELRHYYRDMGDGQKAEMLRRLNTDNPKLELKELPKIGITDKGKGERAGLRKPPDKKPDKPEQVKGSKKKSKGRL